MPITAEDGGFVIDSTLKYTYINTRLAACIEWKLRTESSKYITQFKKGCEGYVLKRDV